MKKRKAKSSLLTCAALAVLVVLSLMGSFATAEGLDFSTTLLGRTYSPALSLNPTVGYGQKIWGDPSTPWYGFIRPAATAVVSPSLYEGKLGIEFFPVSILGVEVTRTLSQRYSETKGQDCLQVQCLGVLNYTDVSFQSYLGLADYYSSIRFTRTFFDAIEDRSRRIYELGTSVLLAPNGETGDFLTVAAGKDLDQDLSIGFLIQTADFKSSGHHQEGQYLTVRSGLRDYGFDGFDALVGLGRFKSDLNLAEFSAILSLTYTHTRAIGYGR